MTRVSESMPTIGFYIPLQQVQCQSVPGEYSQSSHADYCKPGVPYEVLVRFCKPAVAEANGVIIASSVWLGLRPKESSFKETLDWVLYLSSTGIFRNMAYPGVYHQDQLMAIAAEET